ncbi:MAG: hypothetical protein Q9168_001213 [Polycauliona sp. 1 TL-2023]
MAHYDGVTIEVKTNDRTYPMYDDPDADGHEDPFSKSSHPQKYIEAVTGAKFSIVATLNPKFDFAYCDAVRVKAFYDTSNTYYYRDIKRRDSAQIRSAYFTGMQTYCSETKQCHVGDLTFGELQMKDASDSAISLDQIKGLGNIRMSWQRICFGKEEVCSEKVASKIISEVSEKVLKGKAIENTIKPQNLRLVSSVPSKYAEGIPLLGKLGREVYVDILYRSKRTLQMLGCIPRSPSPVQQTTTLGDVAIKRGDPQDELRALRARVAELEKRTSSSPHPNVKSEQHRSTSQIKRERQDTENEVKRKRSRTSGPLEVVDLTAD